MNPTHTIFPYSESIRQKEPKCPWMDRRIDYSHCMCAGEYDSARNRNGALPSTAPRTAHELIMLMKEAPSCVTPLFNVKGLM